MIFQQQSWINIWSIIYVTNLFNSVISEHCNKRTSTLAVSAEMKFLERGECLAWVVKLRNLFTYLRYLELTQSIPWWVQFRNKQDALELFGLEMSHKSGAGGWSLAVDEGSRVGWHSLRLPSMDGKATENCRKITFPRNYLPGRKKK